MNNTYLLKDVSGTGCRSSFVFIWFLQTITGYFEIWYAGKYGVGHSRNGIRGWVEAEF
jgi:hypothetical protein